MTTQRLLIAHPDGSSLALLSSMLRSLGLEIEEATNDRAAVRMLERGGVSAVISAVDPDDPDGLELLTFARRKQRDLPVLLMFTRPDPDRAREASRLGATAVMRFPLPANEIRAAVTQAIGLNRDAEPARPSHGRAAGTEVDFGSTARTRAVEHEPAAASRPTMPEPFVTNGYGHGNGHEARTSTRVDVPAAPSAAPDIRHFEHFVESIAARAPVTSPHGFIGEDATLRQTIEVATSIAPTRIPVLILGERGTGKTLLARTIHRLSPRHELPFVTLDGSMLTSDLLDRCSRAEHARGGTLFLDEVASLSPELQRQLLAILQLAEHDPSSHLDAPRWIVSTAEDLLSLVERGAFSHELYARVSSVCLGLPPLRRRGRDLELLAEHFREKFAVEMRKDIHGFTREAIEGLQRHSWPGNVQELVTTIQRAMVSCPSKRLTPNDLIWHQGYAAHSGRSTPRPHLPIGLRSLKEALEEPEKQIIMSTLQALNWNRQETARVLDINRTTLYKKMKKYGLLIDEPVWMN
ncbi:MAG: sigma-54-dependent Fis family transcriptional regulator [Planctomycetota bacterium]|nr:sigma-54-dependent Fis family transcriptional regulator [Planctomycetota bacterium]